MPPDVNCSNTVNIIKFKGIKKMTFYHGVTLLHD